LDKPGEGIQGSGMTSAPSVYRALAAALRERLEVIADREHYEHDPAGHLERLKAVAATISTLQEQLPPDADPKLVHYLERASFDKALAFVEAFSP
jgi:hypothetical protein